MKTNMLLSVVLLSGLAACASKSVEEQGIAGAVKGPSMEAKQVAMEEEASFVTEFSFKKGSDKLSPAAKEEVRKLIADAKARGNIKEVKVITWGDTEYPSVHTKKLSSKDIELVKRRNNAVRDYVKSVNNDIDVDSHSMAERPGLLKDMFNTTDARVKKSLETAGIPTTDTAVKTPSKASRSIVMVIRE